MSADIQARQTSPLLLKSLIFLMFAAFAMTTDSVGTVIPQIIREYRLGLTAAGSFHYATMSGIGLAAIGLGFLADRIGRKPTILMGLVLFCASSAFFAIGQDFGFFVLLLFLSGLGIGIFKAAALAVVGDISNSTRDHARTMNLIEGFFGVGAIAGPAVVATSLAAGLSWKWVYLIAAALCAILIVGTMLASFPKPVLHGARPASAKEVLRLLADPLAILFAAKLMLYVGAEAAIYVWAPTYFAGYDGPDAWVAAYVVSVFFVLRAAGRFLGAWLLARFSWPVVLTVCSMAMGLLFLVAVSLGRNAALYALPATGLFMSILYPTINSTGISCFPRERHGSIAGFLLFFTCLSAVLAPLAMGAVGDITGNGDFGMILGCAFAVLLAALCLWNLAASPAAKRLAERDSEDYAVPPVSDPVV